MPKAELIDFTGKGRPDQAWYAAAVLIFAKSTRLNMSPDMFREILMKDIPELEEELDAMAKTIPSCWEFADVTFLFSGVTRACAQQITRTRTASYAMQSQRIVNLSDAVVTSPFTDSIEDDDLDSLFDEAANDALVAYQRMIDKGATPQDARGILPMNTQCNLLAKYNLRAFVDLVHSRSSLRTQREYRTLILEARAAVEAVWPWAWRLLERPHDLAIKELEALAEELGVVPGTGQGWRLAKAIDLLRR